MKVFLSELAEKKLLKLSEYLLENWNLKTRDKFISKLTEQIDLLALSEQYEKCSKDTVCCALYAKHEGLSSGIMEL